MRRKRIIGLVAAVALPADSAEGAREAASRPVQAHGVQYSASHVHVEHGKLDDFVTSWEATFGGTHNRPGEFGITPTPSKALASIMHSSVGLLEAYDHQTPVPFPFGLEQYGFAVHDPDSEVDAVRRSGATVPVGPWTGPVSGRRSCGSPAATARRSTMVLSTEPRGGVIAGSRGFAMAPPWRRGKRAPGAGRWWQSRPSHPTGADDFPDCRPLSRQAGHDLEGPRR